MRAIKGIVNLLAVAALLSACSVFHQQAPQMPSREGIVPGETITVEGNPNIYSIARAHNVSMREIIVLNNLQPPFTLRPGQRLVLPAASNAPSGVNAGPWGPQPPMPSAAPTSIVTSEPVSPAHMVQPFTPAQSSADVVPPPVTSAPVDELNKPTLPPKQVLTNIAPSGEQTAVLAPVPLPENKPPSSEEDLSNVPDFVWPLQGPILSSYGPKGQGLSNDGVNIGAPKGAPVVAAASGIVVYAGNEMKGFGNLILIRHENSWVTAYAHLDRIMVTKDAVVAKGDMIGTVGKTGNVPTPQLHFEVRHDSKPLDPASVVKAD